MYRCYVGNISSSTDDQGLRDAFVKYGEVQDAIIMRNRDTGESRGFGFVTYSNEQSMKDAIAGMNGVFLDGRKITVSDIKSKGSGGS